MSKIKFKLEKYPYCLNFQILEMDERFRSKEEEEKYNHFTSLNGIKIFSKNYPFLHGCGTSSEITLRGLDPKSDFFTSCSLFSSDKERDECYNLVLEALKDWSENWVGWKTEKKENKEKPEEQTIFEF